MKAYKSVYLANRNHLKLLKLSECIPKRGIVGY